jgi:APA family basic amino acid/polyamine antiporter
MATPAAFLLSVIIAGFSAYFYPQMFRRFRNSAGETIYIFEGLKSNHLSALTGFAISVSGIVSAATLSSGFTSYF